jgi:hypothetical protein
MQASKEGVILIILQIFFSKNGPFLLTKKAFYLVSQKMNNAFNKTSSFQKK